MKLKNFKILILLVILSSHVANAISQYPNRKSIKLNISELQNNNINWYDLIKDKEYQKSFLKTFGVSIDVESKIWVRAEEQKVELNCSDCIVLDSNNVLYEKGEPINEEHRDPAR